MAEVNFDVVIDTPGPSVDMKAGLDSLQGVSDATRCIAETILNKNVPEKLRHQGKVRTVLKQTFTGSYGHRFSLEVHDDGLKKAFNDIGVSIFVELLGYYLNSALLIDSVKLSPKAAVKLNELADLSEELGSHLRKSAFRHIHAVPVKCNYDLKVRYRPEWGKETTLVTFDQATAEVLRAEVTEERFDIEAAITRLNINTGNGRLQINGETETVAFGFDTGYKNVRNSSKKVFSENLDYNNGLESGRRKYLKLSVSPVRLPDKKVIKYFIRGIYAD